MIEHGYSLHFGGDKCTIYDKADKRRIIAEVKMKDRNFPIQWSYATAMKVQRDDSWLWHKRFGHFNYRGLKMLHQKNMIRDMPKIEDIGEVCEGCQLGKQKRLPFPSKDTWRAKRPLELVHTDVCGPMRTPTPSNNRYFILFIDDYSRMTWVYFLRERSEVFNIFKKFKNMVEKQSGHHIKVLRSDRGAEYTSREFNKFCEDEGVSRQLTVGYASEQNGVSERKNRTMMEMARSMLGDKGIPKTFWAEAVHTAVYLLNRCPTVAVQDKTPIEVWSGKKPSAKHLKVFGSICYIHIPQQKRSKLDDKSEKGIFFGYSTQSKGYRIYNIKTKKLIISRDVEFDEAASWNWDEEKVENKNIYISRERSPVQKHDQGEHPAEEDEPTIPQASPPREDDLPDDMPQRKVKTLQELYETCNFITLEPESFEVASKQEAWVKAMEEEINMIEKNKTWELVNKPKDKDVIGVKWVYKTKFNSDGSIQKHKARLVVKGYAQQPGVDYSETFAPVARMDTIRALIAIAAQNGWKIHQLDIKSAFLNRDLEEDIYVEQPQGFVVKGQEGKILKLKKALYGLKQAPRAWYSKIDNYFTSQGFRRSKSEPTLYTKAHEGKILILSLSM